MKTSLKTMKTCEKLRESIRKRFQDPQEPTKTDETWENVGQPTKRYENLQNTCETH